MAEEGDETFCDVLVVEIAIDRIGARGVADVGGHLEVETHGLPSAPLPLPNADDGLDSEIAQKYSVHGALLGAQWRAGGISSSSGQRGRATMRGGGAGLRARCYDAP